MRATGTSEWSPEYPDIDSNPPPIEQPKMLWTEAGIVILLLILIALLLSGCDGDVVYADTMTGTASYYTRASCAREGTGGPDIRMANGRRLVDENFTAASWFYPFGTRLKVSKVGKKGKVIHSVIVVITDRGPNWSLVKKGRKIDLSYAAMAMLGGIDEGTIPVKIEIIK